MVLRRKVRWLVPVIACVCVGASGAPAHARPKPKPQPAPQPAPDVGTAATGVAALWHMDETSGTSMLDAVGGHTGRLSSVQLGQPGFSGTSYGLSRSTITVPSAPNLNPGNANLTATIHMRTTSAPATPDWDLFRKGQYTTAGGEWKMEYQPNGQASCGFKGSSRYAELAGGPSLKDGRWHTVSCVKTATAISVVVDGRAFSKSVVIGSIANSAPVVLGSYPGAEFFQGWLDEASISFG